MEKRDVFSSTHPAVSFVYFVLVICFVMVSDHPAVRIISLAGAAAWSFYQSGARALRFDFLFLLPVMLFTAALNPLFNHQGVTVIAYFPSGNALTLESIVYGIFSAVMLAAVLNWFSCWNKVMTSDKLMYIFGKIIPSLSLVLSMTLRLVPRFITRLKEIYKARKSFENKEKRKIADRLKNAGIAFAAAVTWAMENSIEISASMKSRGYGLKKRTAFSNYTFTGRDRKLFAVIILLAVVTGAGAAGGALYWRYFPGLKGTGQWHIQAVPIASYAALSFLPVILNLREDALWKRTAGET